VTARSCLGPDRPVLHLDRCLVYPDGALVDPNGALVEVDVVSLQREQFAASNTAAPSPAVPSQDPRSTVELSSCSVDDHPSLPFA